MADDSTDACQTVPEDVAEPLPKRAKLSEAATTSDSFASTLRTDIDPDILKNLGMPHQPNREYLCAVSMRRNACDSTPARTIVVLNI